MEIEIKRPEEHELTDLAEIALENFKGFENLESALNWVECNYRAYPRMQYFSAKDEKTLGYILWMEKGGFRKESVWELEQIAVRKDNQANGIGKLLIRESLREVKNYLEQRGARLKLAEVTTGTENKAQQIYRKLLGAEVE